MHAITGYPVARIRKIEISNFRRVQQLIWCPSPGINCLIGVDDSGKSAVLDAIDLCLGARRNVQISDADFFGLNITVPISITLTLDALDHTAWGLGRKRPACGGCEARARREPIVGPPVAQACGRQHAAAQRAGG